MARRSRIVFNSACVHIDLKWRWRCRCSNQRNEQIMCAKVKHFSVFAFFSFSPLCYQLAAHISSIGRQTLFLIVGFFFLSMVCANALHFVETQTLWCRKMCQKINGKNWADTRWMDRIKNNFIPAFLAVERKTKRNRCVVCVPLFSHFHRLSFSFLCVHIECVVCVYDVAHVCKYHSFRPMFSYATTMTSTYTHTSTWHSSVKCSNDRTKASNGKRRSQAKVPKEKKNHFEIM